MKIRRAERGEKIIGEAILLPLKEGVVAVDEWVPEEKDKLVTYAGKTAIVRFDKIFKRKVLDSFCIFDISRKAAYYGKLELITHYINYFEKFYDKDHELIMAYLELKYLLDIKTTRKIKRSSMIKQIYHTIFTPSMCQKIVKMSEDNYRVDLSKKKKTSGKGYPVALQFTEHHAEILMRMSLGIKFMIPIVLHYIEVFQGKDECRDNLYKYFIPLFKIKELNSGVAILAKLYHTVGVRVNSKSKPEGVIYGKQEAIGSSVESFSEDLFHKNLVTDTIFSYQYKGNIVSYNSVVLKYQLVFHSREDLNMNFNQVDMERDTEGLSSLDRMEIYTPKVDAFTIIFSDVNINDCIKRIKKRIKMDITDDEIKYYLKYLDYNKVSRSLIFYFYAKYFGGFRDLGHIKKRQYVELMIIMKRILVATGYKYLDQIISAEIEGKSSARVIRNQKFIEKIETSSVYQNLMKNKYPSLTSEKDSPVIAMLSRIINTNWKIIDYDVPEKLGERIEMVNDVISDEFLRFVDGI